MAKLTAKDFILEQQARRLLAKAGVRRLPFRYSYLEREQAVTGLVLLEELPPDAEQELVNLSTNTDPELAGFASWMLRGRQEGFDPIGTPTSPPPLPGQ